MAKEKLTKARVLITGVYGACDDVVEVDAAQLAEGKSTGDLDDHPDAVAYAESLK